MHYFIRLPALLSIVLIVYASLYPFTGWQAAPSDPWIATLSSLRDPSFTDILGNVLFYIPAGFFLAAALPSRWRPLALAPVSLFALSVTMEATQLWLPGRTTSAVDVATNALGAVLGAATAALLRDFARSLPAWLQTRVRTDPAGLAALMALALWAAATLAPFVPSIDPTHLATALKPLLQAPASLSARGLIAEAAAVGIAVLLAGRVLVRPSRGLAGIAVAVFAVAAHLVVVERVVTAELVAGAGIGGALGAILSARRFTPVVLLLLAAATVIAAEWHPPETARAAAMNLVPFRAHLWDPLRAVVDITGTLWPYAAATAALIQLGPDRPARAGVMGAAVATVLSGITEWSQRWTPSAYADITDVAAALAGAGLAAVAGLAGQRRLTAMAQPTALAGPSSRPRHQRTADQGDAASQWPADFSSSRNPASGNPRP